MTDQVPDDVMERFQASQAPAVDPDAQARFDASQRPEPVPPSFLHRLATGLMVGGAADASPEELRQKGFEDFNYPANVVQAFKGGFDRANKAKAAIQGGATGTAKLGAEWDEMMGGVEQLASPLTAAFQLAGGIGEKASGGLLSSESIQDALMLSDGAPMRISRVRNGVEQVIGDLPKDGDFKTAAAALSPTAPETIRSAAIRLKDGSVYSGATHADALIAAQDARGEHVSNDITSIDEKSIAGDFLTSTGRLVGRFEAERIANAAAQTKRTEPDVLGLIAENLRDLWQERGIHPAEAVHDAQSDAFLKGDLTRKNLEPPDRSDIPPVQGTPAPEGTPRTELAKTGEPHIDRILDSEPTKQVIDSPVVDRAHTVPYTAGGSVPLDDPTFFIDKRFPHSFTIDGTTFDPASPFAVHENVEQHTMEMLTKGGMDAPTAYKVAHFEFAEKAEGAWYAAHGIDQAKAEAAYAPYMADIQKAPPAPPPVKYDPLEMARSGELTADRAVEVSKELRGGQEAAEDKIFGKETADRWRKLHRQSDRAWDSANDDKAREYDRQIGEIEEAAKLSKKDDDYLNGVGWSAHSNPDTWKDLARDLRDVEGDRDDAVATTGYSLRRLPSPGARISETDRETMAVIQHAIDEESKRGGDPERFLKDAFNKSAERYGGGHDAAEIVGNDIERLKALLKNPPPALSAPELPPVPPNLYKRPYPHDDPSAARNEPIAEPKPSKDEIAQAKAILDSQEAGGALRSGGADVTRDMPDLATQPPRPAGSLMTAAKAAADKLFDIGRDAQMLVAPMARGTRDSMAAAKDFANSMRRNRWEWSRVDSDIAKRFSPEQRKRMWDAADEESVARQLGESREHQGLVTLEPEERAAVEQLQTRAQLAWVRARDMGMVDGEGLPAYTPRMVINAASAVSGDAAIPLNGLGANLRTRTAQMMRRKYMTAEETEAAAKARLGDDATIARDIRALPLATAKLEDAIAGRSLIDNIKAIGRQTGAETVADGFRPDSSWFTLDHPSFRTFKVIDGVANQVPLYVRGDFEGPLRAVLNVRKGAQTYSGMAYGSMMALKGKTMSLIMNSPLIHNAVEWGRALPAMPGKVATFKVYFEGNRAKNDVATMKEAIDGGLVPIGHRFFNQDITSIMEEPNLTPGRSWTSQVLGFVPGLFDEGAGTAVKAAIDKAGNFWHNTLLWDRVADLQMGLYTNFRDDLLAKGVDGQTAARAAAHWANRYAGALPKEAMSDAATKTANMLLFSRSFTMGNLGVLKDMLTGLPKDVMAQIERDAGFGAGAINEALPGAATTAVQFAKTQARRKAMAVVALDMGLFYVGNSVLQSALNVMKGDNTLDQEMHGYAQRLSAALTETKEHPLKLLQPFNFLQSLSSTSANEPGKEGRIKVGHAKDGTAIYARNPAGKIGEEFVGYMTGPLDMMRRKLGTVARPAWQVMNNDAGFGRKIYDPDADTPAKYLRNLGAIAEHIAGAQLPEGQIGAFSDLVKGEGDAKVNAAQALGPVAGVTFAKGAPGGEAVGELYHARTEHNYAVDQALPDIRRQIQRGDEQGARDRMTELGIPRGLQNFYVRTSVNPATRLSGKTLRDFYQFATPEQKARMENAR